MSARGLWQRWKRTAAAIRGSDLYDTSTLKKNRCKNDGYGELLTSFTTQLISILNINEKTRVVDVGSGLGLFALDLAALTKCTVVGVEIRGDLYQRSLDILEQAACLNMNVNFLLGDATQDGVIDYEGYDVVVCCNTLWSSETNHRLLQKLAMELREDGKLVVLEQLSMHRFHEGSSAQVREDTLSSAFDLPPLRLDCEPGGVSWTASSLPYYIYSKKSIPPTVLKRIAAERSRESTILKRTAECHEARVKRAKEGAKKRKISSPEVEISSKGEIDTPPKVKNPAKPRQKAVTVDDLNITCGSIVAVQRERSCGQERFWLGRVRYIYCDRRAIKVAWFNKEPFIKRGYHQSHNEDRISLNAVILPNVALKNKKVSTKHASTDEEVWYLRKKDEDTIMACITPVEDDEPVILRAPRARKFNTKYDNFVA